MLSDNPEGQEENERGDDMSFREMLLRAKAGEEKLKLDLWGKYKPLLIRNSILNGFFDEDLYQEQCLVLMKCISLFTMSQMR